MHIYASRRLFCQARFLQRIALRRLPTPKILLGMVTNLARPLVALLLPASLVAQEIPQAEYAARRDSLAAHIDSGVVVAFGATDPLGIQRGTQLAAFRYLTGFLEPNAGLVLVKRGGTTTGTLFTASTV